MSTRAQKVCAYSGYLMIGMFFLGFGLAGFVTPPSPAASAETIAQVFDDDRNLIRIGLIVAMFSAALLVPWGVSLFQQLQRAAGRQSPWPWVVVLSVTLFSLEFIYLLMFWQVAAFRADLAPDSIRMLNDMAWIPFVGLSSTAVVASLAIAFAITADARRDAVFPRWLSYFNVWTATLFTPGSVCVFFHDGPLAYNGVLAWYVPVTDFTAWMVVNTIFCVKAIKKQGVEEAANPTPLSADGSNVEFEELARQVADLRQELQRQPVAVGH